MKGEERAGEREREKNFVSADDDFIPYKTE
jgi:hypothetical protein